MKTINAIIQLRRDKDYNFEAIQNTYVPMDGEVVLVDTSTGLRAKVGDGVTVWAQLPYTDERIINNIDNIVVYGYFLNNIFYTSSTYTEELPREFNKIYIDKNSNIIYHYDGLQYVSINDTLPTASSVVAGISKLYQDGGQNEDGSMSQKAVTNGVQSISFTIDDEDTECLVLDLPWD